MLEAPRRFYLCPPDHFQIRYAINAWMDVNNPVDPARASEQWQSLYETYRRLGADVQVLDPEPGVSEFTFPGDSIFLFGDTAVSSRFRHPERDPEVAPMARRFASRGYTVHPLPEGLHLEGNAEAIYWHGQLFGGHGLRSDRAALLHLGTLLDIEVHTFEIREPYFHFDVTFFPIDKSLAAYNPAAFNADGMRLLERLCPDLIPVDEAEARVLACNGISLNHTVVVSTPLARRFIEAVRARGKEVVALDLSEFRKAGGGAKCLTLEAYEYQRHIVAPGSSPTPP